MLNRRELHTYELGAYISAYANIFENWTRFPEVTMMLNTTTSANNFNALVIAANYKRRDEDQNWSIPKDLCSNNEYQYRY